MHNQHVIEAFLYIEAVIPKCQQKLIMNNVHIQAHSKNNGKIHMTKTPGFLYY